jgi:hypothetical protein
MLNGAKSMSDFEAEMQEKIVEQELILEGEEKAEKDGNLYPNVKERRGFIRALKYALDLWRECQIPTTENGTEMSSDDLMGWYIVNNQLPENIQESIDPGLDRMVEHGYDWDRYEMAKDNAMYIAMVRGMLLKMEIPMNSDHADEHASRRIALEMLDELMKAL